MTTLETLSLYLLIVAALYGVHVLADAVLDVLVTLWRWTRRRIVPPHFGQEP